MKVVAFCGSPRRGGNTEQLIRTAFKPLEEAGIETELVTIGGKAVHGCTACMKCAEKQDGKCIIDKDFVNDAIAKMREADGVILGSPTYFANVSTEMKALIDRAGMVTLVNDYQLKHKVGGSVVAVRRGGAMQVYNALNTFFGISQMITVGSSYWNMGRGLDKGDVQNDEEGLQTMENLGKNMAWLLKKIED